METTAAAAVNALAVRRERGSDFPQLLLNVGNNSPDLIPVGGRDPLASRPSMGGPSSGHTPLTRDTLF